MDQKKIIMNFSVPPSAEDIEVLAQDVLDNLPDELVEVLGKDIELVVEEFPDAGLEEDMDLDSPYDLLAFYQGDRLNKPGVVSKGPKDAEQMMLFRRSLLDAWCDTGDDLNEIIRYAVIAELGQSFDFGDEEIEEMAAQHHQGMFAA